MARPVQRDVTEYIEMTGSVILVPGFFRVCQAAGERYFGERAHPAE